MFCCLTASTARALLCMAVWSLEYRWWGCGLSWAWTLSLVPVWLTDSRGQPCTVDAHVSTCCIAWPWGWSLPKGSWWTYPLTSLLCRVTAWPLQSEARAADKSLWSMSLFDWRTTWEKHECWHQYGLLLFSGLMLQLYSSRSIGW